MQSKTHFRRTYCSITQGFPTRRPAWTQLSFVTPFIRPYKNAKPEQNVNIWTTSDLRGKFKTWHQTYKQLSTRTVRLAYGSIHRSAKLSARILIFSMNIRCSTSSNELTKIKPNSPRSLCRERQSSRQSVGYQDYRTQNGYRTAIFITSTRRTLSLT